MTGAPIALLSGALFGAGLAFSGMADPKRVQGFLNLFGTWDPTLAFVMGGAILPMAAAWLWQKRLTKPFADAQFELPPTTELNAKLAIGSVLFGVGWGISGLCPGPAVANLGLAPLQVMPFILAMTVGMIAHRVTTR
jgi:uncharacterized membrane protein YedE/YeeE